MTKCVNLIPTRSSLLHNEREAKHTSLANPAKSEFAVLATSTPRSLYSALCQHVAAGCCTLHHWSDHTASKGDRGYLLANSLSLRVNRDLLKYLDQFSPSNKVNAPQITIIQTTLSLRLGKRRTWISLHEAWAVPLWVFCSLQTIELTASRSVLTVHRFSTRCSRGENRWPRQVQNRASRKPHLWRVAHQKRTIEEDQRQIFPSLNHSLEGEKVTTHQ